MRDMNQNIYLRPDDFLYLPSSLSQEVYVLVKVRRPTNVPYMNEVSLVAPIPSRWPSFVDRCRSRGLPW